MISFRSVLKRGAVAVSVSLALGAGAVFAGSSPAGAEVTHAGRQLSPEEVMEAAYQAGFHTEEQLLVVTSIAVAESSLWSGFRNSHPEYGTRSTAAGTEPHADRGLFQINSYFWPQYSDAATDDPFQAARIVHEISRGGSDFTPWHTYEWGWVQRYWDAPYDGWPALRPRVRAFLWHRNSAAAPVHEPQLAAAVGEVARPLGLGGTLYKLAIEHYGNSDAWPYIAHRNGITVPEHLLAEQLIIIP